MNVKLKIKFLNSVTSNLFQNMYSSSNPSPSSIHGLPPPSGIVFDPEKDGLYFNHHPFVSKEYYYFDHASPPPPVKDSGLQNCDNSSSNPNLSGADITPCNKKVMGSKKDRHSKIFTARGPRDRRVRLSIDISKKFFGLQDLLGFDTASKTLDWLFTKSKNAIKDLVEEMKHTSSSTLSDQCEEVFMEKGDYLDKKVKNKKCVNRDKTMKTTRKKKSGLHVNLSARKQLRAEARSRARERTIEKLLLKKLNKDVQNVLGDYNYCYLESSSGNQFQSQSNHEVQIGKSLIELELPKQYSLLYDSQQEYVNSNDSSSQFKNSTL